MIKKLFLGTFGIVLNVIIYVLIILFAVRVVTYAYNFSYQVFGNVAVSENSQEVVPVQIPEGASTDEVAAQLKKTIAKYELAVSPAIIPIPGVKGNTGDGVAAVKQFVEQAVGSDILFGGN